MLRLRSVITTVALLAFSLTLSAQDEKATLKWKFEKDKTFYQEMKTTTQQSMKVMGTNVTQDQSQTFFFSWTPTAIEGDKVTLKQKIVGVVMSIDIGGSKIDYDSRDAEASKNSPLKSFFDALLKAEFEVVVDQAKGEVLEVKNYQKFVKDLTDANPQMKGLLDQILGEQALKEMAGPTFGSIPGVEKKKGDTWQRKVTLDMGPIGKYETTYDYKFTGTKESTAEIGVTTTLKYTPPAADAKKTLPFTIKEADLKASDASGTISFDTNKGQIKSSTLKMKLGGTMKIEIGGQTTTVELDQNQTTETTVSEKDPTKEG